MTTEGSICSGAWVGRDELRNLIQHRKFSGRNSQAKGVIVFQAESPREADIKATSDKLNEGLKNCRSVLENYRILLHIEPSDDPNGPLNDNQQ